MSSSVPVDVWDVKITKQEEIHVWVYHFNGLAELPDVDLVCCRRTIKGTNIQWFDPFGGD